jgi:hypothetical protein
MRLVAVLLMSVLLVSAVLACAPIDGSTVACDINVPTDAGTWHAWCTENYGVPPGAARQLEAECTYGGYPFREGVGTVLDACPTGDVYATCSETLAAPDGDQTVFRLYLYGRALGAVGPYELSVCPTPTE